MRVYEYLKIQKGGVYIEVLMDEKALENIAYIKDLLDFLIKVIKKS